MLSSRGTLQVLSTPAEGLARRHHYQPFFYSSLVSYGNFPGGCDLRLLGKRLWGGGKENVLNMRTLLASSGLDRLGQGGSLINATSADDCCDMNMGEVTGIDPLQGVPPRQDRGQAFHDVGGSDVIWGDNRHPTTRGGINFLAPNEEHPEEIAGLKEGIDPQQVNHTHREGAS